MESPERALQPRSDEGRVAELIDKLRASGYRITPQRVAILRALVKSKAHPSADEVYHDLLPAYPMLSPATVYKTINALKQLGEVLELQFRDGSNRYDVNTPAPHPHLICRRCGKLVDLDDRGDDLNRFSAEISTRTGYADVRYRLDFSGICPTCQRKRG